MESAALVYSCIYSKVTTRTIRIIPLLFGSVGPWLFQDYGNAQPCGNTYKAVPKGEAYVSPSARSDK